MTEAVDERRVTKLSPTQRVIARRMTEAQQVPTFTVTRDLDVTRLVRQRERLKSAGVPAPSLNDVLVLAVARSLVQHPKVNGSYSPEGFLINDEVNIGVAVASGDRLVVPVVRNADGLDLARVGAESKRLSEAVRSGRIDATDLAGATFTISNLGMMGVDHFTAMINVPQAAILAVGRVRRMVTFDAGAVGTTQVVAATLTADHRIVYGADAARFLTTLDEELQSTSLVESAS